MLCPLFTEGRGLLRNSWSRPRMWELYAQRANCSSNWFAFNFSRLSVATLKLFGFVKSIDLTLPRKWYSFSATSGYKQIWCSPLLATFPVLTLILEIYITGTFPSASRTVACIFCLPPSVSYNVALAFSETTKNCWQSSLFIYVPVLGTYYLVPTIGTMYKSLHSPENNRLIGFLKQERERQDLTMRDLAARLDVAHSFIGKVEQGERRLDVIESFNTVRR